MMVSEAKKEIVLQARGLCLERHGQSILQDWSADIPAGLCLVLGGEGSGKTSMLRLLAAELTADAGGLTLAGLAHGGADYGRQVFWRDPRQAWPDNLTPQAWSQEQATSQPRWSQAQWLQHVAGFALEEHLHKAMYQLSTGSQRKVLLAAALASGATLILVDDPVAALDRAAIAYWVMTLQREAAQLAASGQLLVVAHYDRLDTGLPWSHVLRLGA